MMHARCDVWRIDDEDEERGAESDRMAVAAAQLR